MSQDQSYLPHVLQELSARFGEQQVLEAAKEVLGLSVKPIPAEYVQIISAQKLADTVAQLDGCVSDLLEKGHAREAVYDNKAELVAKKTKLETEIKLTEAEAVMNIQGDGKNAYVIHEGKQIPITNETARDAWRRTASSSLRRDLAEVEAQIAKIDVELFRSRDAWETTEKATGMIQSKAFVQGNLLRFLGGRGV